MFRKQVKTPEFYYFCRPFGHRRAYVKVGLRATEIRLENKKKNLVRISLNYGVVGNSNVQNKIQKRNQATVVQNVTQCLQSFSYNYQKGKEEAKVVLREVETGQI